MERRTVLILVRVVVLLVLHSRYITQVSPCLLLALSSCYVFLPHDSAEIEQDDEEVEGEQCHSSIEL